VLEDLARAVWYGEGFGALIARAALTPAEWLYGAVSLIAGAARARGAGASAVPTVSVGNITVGGTGKTPMAAWVAAELRARGCAPAILLRGYGDDEPLVHAVLNPTVAVVANPSRRSGGAQAVAQGATALVLDDAFQHRQMPRDADIVLVSADLWHDVPVRLLPAGPFREPLLALRRASCIVVTRKSATVERAGQVVAQLQRAAGDVPIAVVHLAPHEMREWSSDGAEPLASLRGERVLAVSGIGAPDAFLAQLRAMGAAVAAATYADHHAYSTADVAHLTARARDGARVLCTLKDAVKLGPLWPADAPRLWYLTQSVIIETGASTLHALLDRVAAQ
jgi:tetraacyldisaccharide 4'-kinase